MSNLTTCDVIRALRVTKYLLLPKVLVSDNGSCFTSSESQRFCNTNKIKHVLSPAFRKQSNVAAEKFIDTLKDFLNKNNSGAVPTDLLVTNFGLRLFVYNLYLC